MQPIEQLREATMRTSEIRLQLAIVIELSPLPPLLVSFSTTRHSTPPSLPSLWPCRINSSAAPVAPKSTVQARLRSIAAENSLADDGIVRVPVDTAMVDEMLAAFQQLRETTGNQFRRCAPAWGPVSRMGARENIMWTEEIPCSVEASNFRLADGADEVYDV